MTLIGMRDFGCMPDSDRMLDSDRKIGLRSYARLRSKDMTLIICVTPVLCPITVGRHDSGRMSDSDRKTRLRSYVLLWLEDITLVIFSTPVRRYDFGRIF
jgi:hypothetical protein